MLRQSTNLKRAFALLGVMLAMSSGFQQAHWFCVLGGCMVAEVEDHILQDAHACCHSHSSDANKTAELAKCDQSENNSCPCPPECWCHQTPQPLELPRSAPETSELLLLSFDHVRVTSVAAANYDLTGLSISTWANEALAESSVECCAHLCRFLI